MPVRPSPRHGRRKRALFPNSMMRRRAFVAASLSLAASRAFADDKPVRFSVTGAHIPLDALRYWSVDLQEAYASPDIATARAQEKGLAPK